MVGSWSHRARGLGAIALLVAAACEPEPSISAGRSRLVIEPARIEFGRMFLGQTATATATMLALGDVAVRFEGQLVDARPGLRIGPGVGVIPAGTRAVVRVDFTPQAVGALAARVVFASDAALGGDDRLELAATIAEPPLCEDGNGCTEDRFDLTLERCVHEAAALPCSDFSACTTGDTCVEGRCVGQGLDCDDGDPCTDDLCDASTGCVHVPTRTCDDGNPCTTDRCRPMEGCDNDALADGTPCDDGELCTTADICLFGRCRGVSVPEGTVCDDGDPCSKADRCLDGACLDPTYAYPTYGEVAFTATIARLAPGSASNPVVDAAGTTFVATSTGVLALDLCGDRLWARTTTDTPAWSAAVSFPGVLLFGAGARFWVVDAATGDVVRTIPLDEAFDAPTAATSTVVHLVVDAAVRASGTVVASLVRREQRPSGEVRRSILAEIDWRTGVATRFRDLGDGFARRVAIDLDEALVALVEAEDRTRLVRFGLEAQPRGSWSTASSSTAPTELALGPNGEVTWTDGLVQVSARGERRTLLGPTPIARDGAPIVGGAGRVYMVRPRDGALGGDLVVLDPSRSATTTPVVWTRSIGGQGAAGLAPARDAQGVTYVATRDPALLAFAPDGRPVFVTALPVPLARDERISVTVTPRQKIVLVGRDHLIGVQGVAGLEASSWPRHRRDNLSSGHR
jgi:outer membrane protein assembly factor BamB